MGPKAGPGGLIIMGGGPGGLIMGGGPGGLIMGGGPGGLGWADASSRLQAHKARATTQAVTDVRVLMVTSPDAPGLR
jgi:hypothetical protein